MNLTKESREALALSRVPGLGPMAYKKLTQARRRELLTPELLAAADREIEKALKGGVEIISCHDARYPESLKAIYDPPIVLYVRGNLPEADTPRIAVVGSRVCSLYGKKMANTLARELAQNGVVIVSGLALGIDTAAHEGALEGGGLTLAVLGGGISRIYPAENKKLAEKVTLISEYPMDMEPKKEYFPVRNRIVNGLSQGVVVVEAKEKSGALITAHLALEEGREVFAVPGNADASRSQGTNGLLKQGAKLVTCAADVLEELNVVVKRLEKRSVPVGADEEAVLSLMDSEPLHVDELIEGSRLGSSRIIAALSLLEIKGLVKQQPGKHFIKS